MGISRSLLFAVLCATLACAALGLAQDTPPEAILKDSDRVSLNLRNVDLFRVVELLMHDRGLNIVAAPELNKKVTVRLQGVNWREALQVILRQSGMGMEQVGNIVRIDTLDRILSSPLRVEYPVKHLEKTDVESLARSTVTSPSTFQVIEAPGGLDHPREVTLVLNATGPEQEKMAATLRRADIGTTSRPVTVRQTGDGGLLAIDIDDMPVVQALEELGREVGFSVVWEDPPRGRARAHLARVTVTEALAAVLSPLGLAFEISGHVLRVGEKARFQTQPRSRVFKVAFANPLHVKALVTPLLTKAGKIEVLGDVREAVVNTAATATPAATVNGAVNGLGTNAIGARQTGQRARATQELTRQQPPSGTLLVTDVPSVLDQIEATIAQLDKPAESVEIETKLVEVSLTKDVQLGIKWDANISATGASGTVVKFPLTEAQLTGQALTNTFTLGTLSAANFNVLLRALQQKNKVKVLSAPRVTTLSHEPARILIGQRFPITVAQNNQQVNVLTTSLDYYEDIGIALTVTPRVTAHDLINLSLKPEVSSIASLVDNRFPIIDTREAETRLLLRSGHTAVIGGLLQDRVERDEQGLPGLASLPIVGKLFGQTHRTKKRTELLVCVTPRIMAQVEDEPPEVDADGGPSLPPPPPGRAKARRVVARADAGQDADLPAPATGPVRGAHAGHKQTVTPAP